MTSIEWLRKELQKGWDDREVDYIIMLIDKSKAMHKAEMIDFATQFAKDYIGFDSVSSDPNATSPAEHYYNQKFKQD